MQQQERVNDKATCTCMLLYLIFALKNTHTSCCIWMPRNFASVTVVSHVTDLLVSARRATQRLSGIVSLLWRDNTASKSFVCVSVRVCETILDTQAQKVTCSITQPCVTNATWHILTGAHCRAGWWTKRALVRNRLCCSDRAQQEGWNRVRFSLYRLLVGVET